MDEILETNQIDNFQDELDKISIEQLHQVVLQFSSNCFETKKLCVTVLVSASVLITSFTDKKLDYSFFVAGSVITIFFWFLDGYNYFYQDKLRSRMKELAEHIVARHKSSIKVENDDSYIKLQTNEQSIKLGEEESKVKLNDTTSKVELDNNEPGVVLDEEVEGIGMPISESREQSSSAKRFIRSAINFSMVFYMILVFLNVLIAFLFYIGRIKNAG